MCSFLKTAIRTLLSYNHISVRVILTLVRYLINILVWSFKSIFKVKPAKKLSLSDVYYFQYVFASLPKHLPRVINSIASLMNKRQAHNNYYIDFCWFSFGMQEKMLLLFDNSKRLFFSVNLK